MIISYVHDNLTHKSIILCNSYNIHIIARLFENRLYNADNFVYSFNSYKIASANILLSGYLLGEKKKE